MTTNLADTASYREREQIARIRRMAQALMNRDGQAFLDAQAFARENVNDLDAIERNTRSALEAVHEAEYQASVEYRDEINGLLAGMRG